MIRAALLTLLASLLLAGCGQERQERPSVSGSPALWAVENAGGDTVGWLFGTIHALPDGARWQTPALDRAIAGAQVLVVEVRDLDPARLAAQFERLASDTPGPPLSQRLPPAVRADFRELLEREGQTTRRFDRMETWAAALALAQLGNDAGNTRNGADKLLLARFARRPVRELEGAADQLAIFDALSETDQRAMLTAIIAEQDRRELDGTALAGAWLAGDTARMKALIRTGLLASPALYEALLADRNRRWMAAILPMLDQGERPLVAVGTAHLLGRDGLPALLAAEGYAVRRIQ